MHFTDGILPQKTKMKTKQKTNLSKIQITIHKNDDLIYQIITKGICSPFHQPFQVLLYKGTKEGLYLFVLLT